VSKRQQKYPNLHADSAPQRSEKQSGRKPSGGRQRSNANLKRGGSPGRPRGRQNQATRDGKAFAAFVLEDPKVQARMLHDARRGKLAPAVLCMLFHYAYGKPKENVELKVLEELRVTITDDIGEEPTSAPGDTSTVVPFEGRSA
jgi:hypothetical protein